MAKEFFPALTGPPAADKLKYREHGNDFDAVIRGWTKYWNEIFQPRVLLDPNLVKALIATESGFDPDSDTGKKGSGRARGLMQVTDGARRSLSGKAGDLGNHLVTLSDSGAYDPNLNIAAGVRWLFEKQRIASHKLKREADWLEAAFEYKGILGKPKTKRDKAHFPEIKARLSKYYRALRNAERK